MEMKTLQYIQNKGWKNNVFPDMDIVYGDIFLEHVKNYREVQLHKSKI